MITRAIVDTVINKYNVRIRIPKKHKIETANGATPSNQLPVATICYQPGYPLAYNKGDIVYIEYENEDYSKPVILGKLYNEEEDG